MKRVLREPIYSIVGWIVPTVDAPYHYLKPNGIVEYVGLGKSVYFKTEQEALDAIEKYNGDKVMRKKDLKTGMIVELVDGEKRLVIANTLIGLVSGSGGIAMSYVNDDLTLDTVLHGDIVKVYSEPHSDRPDHHIGSDLGWFMHPNCTKLSKLLWERQAEEMTLEQVCEMLGKDIKIVKGV